MRTTRAVYEDEEDVDEDEDEDDVQCPARAQGNTHQCCFSAASI
jgi:hypothetical protein